MFIDVAASVLELFCDHRNDDNSTPLDMLDEDSDDEMFDLLDKDRLLPRDSDPDLGEHIIEVSVCVCVNTLNARDGMRLMSDFRQCPWDFGSAPTERAGLGEVGGFQHSASVAWPLLGLALKSSWLDLGGPFLSFAQMG